MRRTTFLFACLLLIISYTAKADLSIVELVKDIKPAVVLIETFDENSQPMAQGTGFFINNEGHIITNLHVLENANWANVRTITGQNYFVRGILAKDKEADLVKLVVDVVDGNIPFVELESKLPSVGEDVVVVGNHMGLESTVSKPKANIFASSVIANPVLFSPKSIAIIFPMGTKMIEI